MQVLSIGNVVQCNSSYIFINNEGKQDRIRATVYFLMIIRDTASNNYKFYNRMREELDTAYNNKKAEVENGYKYITDEMVKEAFRESTRKGVDLSLSKDSNNEEVLRQYGKLSGIAELIEFASANGWEAYHLMRQADIAIESLSKG